MALSHLRFDFRTPSFGKASAEELYATSLEMARWADHRGFSTIIISEHHCAEDGFLSSPLVLAGALVGCTQSVRISVAALLAPLHDPIRLAEDIAVLDLVSGGRVTIVAGLGYRPVEYVAMGKRFDRRGRLFDECLEVLIKAWGGEPFEYNGEIIQVTPKPASTARELLVIGGSSAAAAKRAARFGLSFSPPLHDDELNGIYFSECERLAVEDPKIGDPGEPWMLLVSEDPDRAWAESGPYLLHDARVYASWQRAGQHSYQHSVATTVEELREEGKYRIMSPEECINYAAAFGEHAAFRHFPLGGGNPPEFGWASLETFVNKVLPYVK